MIVVIITARPSYARVKSVLTALQGRHVEFGVIACASALLERYGRVVDVIKADGFPVIEEIHSVYEGSTLETSAIETGSLLSVLSHTLNRWHPKAVVVIADRHEVLAAAIAASFLHLPLVHLQGGESSGSIDHKVRNAITQLANYHCVATGQAKRQISRVCDFSVVHLTGCPSIDLALQSKSQNPVTIGELGGHGSDISLSHPFMVILQHPVTTEVGDQMRQMRITLEATEAVHFPRIVMWPGEEAGHDQSSKMIRQYIDDHPHCAIRTVRNLPPERFLRLLSQSALLVGNSSVGIRECSALGVSVVNIGVRQQDRERAGNVQDVDTWDSQLIADACRRQQGKHYSSSSLYGDGKAGKRIAEILCQIH